MSHRNIDDHLTSAVGPYLEQVCDTLSNIDSPPKQKEAAKSLGLDIDGYSRHPGIGQLPSTHNQFGTLISEPSERYVAKCRYARLDSPIVKEPDAVRESNIRSHHMNENFTEARIWFEAKARNQDHLFAPVAAYDDEHFRWLVMSEVDPEPIRSLNQMWLRPDELSEVREDLKQAENAGWNLHDIEIGWHNNELVAFDYGGFWRTNDQWLTDRDEIW